MGVKSRSFLTLLDSLSSSAAASVRIEIFSGEVTRPSVPLERGVRLVGPERLFGPLGVPDFLCKSELKKFASTPSPEGVEGLSFESI